MNRVAVIVVLGLFAFSVPAGAGIIELKQDNVSNLASLNDVFSDSAITEALASVGVGPGDLSDEYIESVLNLSVFEGSALGSLNDAKTFDLAIPANSFVTLKFGPNIVLVTDMGSDGVESFDFADLLGRSPAPGLSNYRVFTPVPEPSVALLFGLGLTALSGSRRRRSSW